MNIVLKKISKVSIFSALIVLVACSAKTDVVLEEQEPLEKPKIKNLVEIKRISTTKLGGSFNSDSAGFQIKREGQFLYAASQSGIVASVDSQLGKITWKVNTKEVLSAGVGVGVNSVYVATQEGEILSLDKNSGVERWRKQSSNEVLTAPIEGGDVVVVRSMDGKVTGLNSNNGTELWALSRDYPDLSLRREVPPILVGDVALIGLSTGNVLALNIKLGQTLWDLPLATPSGVNDLDRMRDIASKPIVEGSSLFVNSYQGDIIGFNVAKRQVAWKAPFASYLQMDSDKINLFATVSDSSLISLAKGDGVLKWSNKDFLRRGISAPTIIGEHVLVFGNDGDMYLLNKETGTLSGAYKFPGNKVVGIPIVFKEEKSGQLAFSALSDNGNIYTYKIIQ